MPLPVRATFLRAWERPSTAYYVNLLGMGVERERKFLGISRRMNDHARKVMAGRN
jgi:hypothetical protein